jgi:hypothetical protein
MQSRPRAMGLSITPDGRSVKASEGQRRAERRRARTGRQVTTDLPGQAAPPAVDRQTENLPDAIV